MDLWKGKVAVVTGASSGIGYAVCKDLAKHGVIVCGLARRLDRLKELQKVIEAEQGKFYPVRCDVSQEKEIEVAFDYVKVLLGGVDIMVNNAGVVKNGGVLDKDNLDSLRKTMDTNLMGLVSCTKKAFESMAERDVPGYIINISSVAGHSVPFVPGVKPQSNLYCSSKYAVTALVSVLRHELNYLQKPKIRVSNISPGAVDTEIFEAAGSKFPVGLLPMLHPQDIANAVTFLLGSNPRVQVEDFIIRPTGEMF